MTINAAQLMVTIGANTSAAEQGIGGLARLLGPGGILALGAVGAAAAVAGIGLASIKMAGDFQTSLTQLVTGAGESQANLGMLHDKLLQMSMDTGTSTKQLTDGLYMIESAGYHGAAGLSILQAAAEGAKVGAADLGTTADAVTTIMKDYGASGINASQATNALISTVAQGKTHMQDLAGALSAVLPASQAAGVGLADVLGAMAAQTAAGVPAADAATHLRQLLIALQAPSSASAKALRAIGLTTDEVAGAMKESLPDALQMIQQHLAATYGVGTPKYMEGLKNISGGMREMQGMLILTSKGGMKDFGDAMLKIGHDMYFGKNQITGWNLVQGTFNQTMARLGETVKAIMIAIGTQLLPVATQFAAFIGNSLGPLMDGLTGKNKDLSKGLGGDLLKAAKDVSGFFKSDVQPIMKQLGDLWTTTIVPILKTLAEVFLKNILPAVEPVARQFAEKVYPPMIRIAKDVLPILNPALQFLGWIFQNIIGPVLGQTIGFIGTILGLLADLADWISNFVQKPAVKKFFDMLGSLANGVGKGIGGLLNQLPHFASGGTMDQSGLALVGENGPELVTMPGGAQITPMAQLSGGSGGSALAPYGGGAGQAIQITIVSNLKMPSGRLLAQEITPHIHTVIRNATGQRGM